MKPFKLNRNAPDRGRLIGGGTQLVDLMRLGVESPESLTPVSRYDDIDAQISSTAAHLEIGGAARMADVAAHPEAAEFSVLVQSLLQAASPQIRNMATMAGNLLQRTRCVYFRDPDAPCNKRAPRSGCAAKGGDARGLAILGVSEACIANYPGDLANALVALDADLIVRNSEGQDRILPVEDLHTLPGETPHIENVLAPDDRIIRLRVPKLGWSATRYHKVRDRASYAFAIVSAAVALKLANGVVSDARLVLGGLSAKPWRCRAAEQALIGQPVNEALALEVGGLCMADAVPTKDQVFKVDLGRRAVARAILDAAAGH